MPPYRINVLGASGCGASTLGYDLAKAIQIPFFDSDDYYHEPTDPPFQRQYSPVERYQRITTDLAPTAHWILAGGIAGWEPYPELHFTCVVFIYVPAEIRIERLRQREQERFGTRIQPGGDMHSTHRDFLAWASRYDAGDVDGKTLFRHQDYLAKQSCQVLQLDGTRATSEMAADVLNAVGFLSQ